MIEIKIKGFRLDIKEDQIVTFKKAQNLNGVQSRYAFSNTLTIEKTANNLKLLNLQYLPTSKVTSLMNGTTADVILNGSIQLKNQSIIIQKETLNTVDIYILYSDNLLLSKMKSTFLNSTLSAFKYKKNLEEFSFFAPTQESGLLVLEEMPEPISVRQIITHIFATYNYLVYGDFLTDNFPFGEYYVTPNKGIYQIYSSGDGFSPAFEDGLDEFTFLNMVLKFFNLMADIDDNQKTVTINSWNNLKKFKSTFVDLSKQFVNYEEFAFQSKLAKKNELTYKDSPVIYNSFFSNYFSKTAKATYLSSDFGTGALNMFEDSEIDEFGNIPLRTNGAVGEVGAINIWKLSDQVVEKTIFVAGVPTLVYGRDLVSVPMQAVYKEFHKDYTDFILTPIVTNLEFRYNDIFVNDFSITRVFYVEQLSSYWIPLEINFSTKKDKVNVKALMIKARKVPAPILLNYNTIVLNFKEKQLFPLEFLLSMYPMPPNEFDWGDVVFKLYNQSINRLYINDVLLPNTALPQTFVLSEIDTIKIEANQASDTTPDHNSDQIFLQAIDVNGGISNEAYINVVHSGIGYLESNFEQFDTMNYQRQNFDSGIHFIQPYNYVVGLKPNLNNTVISKLQSQQGTIPTANGYSMLILEDDYNFIKVKISSMELFLKTESNGAGKARAKFEIILYREGSLTTLYETSIADTNEFIINTPNLTYTFNDLEVGNRIGVYLRYTFDNRAGSNSGSMNVYTQIKNAKIAFSTTKIV